MEYNIVTNSRILQVVKGYKNFTKSLGYATTTLDPATNEKVLSKSDKFAFFYNNRYRSTIMGTGYIGDINFYNDVYITEDQIAIYVGEEEFVYDFDWKLCKEKGIEWYLGYLLKDVDFKIGEEKLKVKNQKEEKKSGGNPYKLVYGHPDYNPGNVSYEDMKAYMEAKRKGLVK